MTILKFYSDWCAPCKKLSRELENFTVCEIDNINMKTHPEMVEAFQVRRLPTLVLLNDEGKEVHRVTGLISKIELEILVDEKSGDIKVEQGT